MHDDAPEKIMKVNVKDNLKLYTNNRFSQQEKKK